MADRITGLGSTLDQYQAANGEVYLEDLVLKLRKKLEGAKKIKTNFGKLSIDHTMLMNLSDDVCELDDRGYEILGKTLGIPIAYLNRLNIALKNQNIEFWMDQLHEKEVEIMVKDGQLVDIQEDSKIELLDVLDIIDKVMPESFVFNVMQQTNATIVDIYNEDIRLDTEFDTYYGGVRAVVKHSLVAPEISPIFLNINSCGIVECSSFVERMIIKNLSYQDILNLIFERVEVCRTALPTLFETFYEMCSTKVGEPKRRIAHYCQEHSLSERVSAYAVKTFDETGLQEATMEDLINLFSSLGYIDEIKQSSAKKLHRLAGYIIVQSRAERRCGQCDAMLLDNIGEPS